MKVIIFTSAGDLVRECAEVAEADRIIREYQVQGYFPVTETATVTLPLTPPVPDPIYLVLPMAGGAAGLLHPFRLTIAANGTLMEPDGPIKIRAAALRASERTALRDDLRLKLRGLREGIAAAELDLDRKARAEDEDV